MLVTSSFASSPHSNSGDGKSLRSSPVSASCDTYAIADACPRTPRRLANALATPKTHVADLRRGGDGDVLGRLMREHAAGWARITTPDAIAERVASSLGDARVAMLRLASREDDAGLTRRIRIAAIAAGVVGARLDRLVEGARRGVAAVVVDATLRGPVAQALVRGLTLRNNELESVGDSAARRHMRDNDVLIHTLSQTSTARLRDHADIYSIDPDLTRASIATDAIGLAAELFPFEGLESTPGDSFAIDAVRAELASVQPLDAEVRASLQSAALAARRAPPDDLDWLPTP